MQKIKFYLNNLKIWYLGLDKKKKSVLWLYVVCAVILLGGTAGIIFSSVLQADKIEDEARLNKFLETASNLESKQKTITEDNNLDALEDKQQELELDFESDAKDLESNKELIDSILVPISDPISE